LKLKEKELENEKSSEIRDLRLEIEHKDRIIKDLKEEMKGKSSKSRDSQEKIEKLEREILEKNREIEGLRNSQGDIEVSRLEIENKNLAKTVKELQNRVNKGKMITEASFSKETDDLRKNMKGKELENEELVERVKKFQVILWIFKVFIGFC